MIFDPRDRRARHRVMVAFFLGGIIAISLIGWLFGQGDWYIATGGYIVIATPSYLMWELVERHQDRKQERHWQ